MVLWTPMKIDQPVKNPNFRSKRPISYLIFLWNYKSDLQNSKTWLILDSWRRGSRSDIFKNVLQSWATVRTLTPSARLSKPTSILTGFTLLVRFLYKKTRSLVILSRKYKIPGVESSLPHVLHVFFRLSSALCKICVLRVFFCIFLFFSQLKACLRWFLTFSYSLAKKKTLQSVFFCQELLP